MLNQENRLITIDTPLGTDFFIVESFHGEEAISNLFRFDLELRAESMDVAFSQIIDQPITLTLNLPDGSTRFFNGIVSHFSQTLGSADLLGSFFYKCTIVPWTWTLTQTSDLRIFVDKKIPDIIEEVLGEYGVSDYELTINKDHPDLPLCTQFQESDFAFLSRIMERAGIFYFFKHEEDRHTMVITDTNSIVKFYHDDEEALFKTTDTDWHTSENILDLYWREKIHSRQITIKDYNSEMPGADLISSTDTNSELGSKPREFYEFPGDFTSHEDAENISKLRMEEQETKLTRIKGKSTYRTFQAGSKFTLNDYFRQDRNNKTYLLTSVEHSIVRETSTTGLDTGLQYWNEFTCIPTEKPFRPPRKTQKPKVYGVQIGTVTSDPDEYGRVSIEISWDRHKKTIPSVPVSQIMAGKNWGTMFIPHPGHEVVVDFIGGDPDKPIIVGRLYNGDNKPKYPLPAEKTKSVIYSKEGNEIILEDKENDKHILIKQASGNEIRMQDKDYISLHCPYKNATFRMGNNAKYAKDPVMEPLVAIYNSAIGIATSYASVVGISVSIPSVNISSPGFSQSCDGDWYSQNHGNKVTYTKGNFFEYGEANTFKSTKGNSVELTSANSFKCTTGISAEYSKSAKLSMTVGLESQTFIGGKHESHFGAKFTWSYAKEYGSNKAEKQQKVTDTYKVTSEKQVLFYGGPSKTAALILNKQGVTLASKRSYMQIKKDNDIKLQSKNNMELIAKGLDISLEAKEIYLDGKTKLDIDSPNIRIKTNKISIG